MLVVGIASCERKEEPRPGESGSGGGGKEGGASPETSGGPAKTGGESPQKGEEAPVLIEKKPPVAEPVPGQPGMVISPYNGKHIDVKGIPAGTLVADPTYPASEKKHFRVPEVTAQEAAESPKLLDPAILIRPNGPKEEP